MQGPCARCATCKVGTAVEVTCCSHGSMKSHQARSLEHGWGTKPPCGRATRQWKRAGIESGRWVGSVEEVESVVFTSCWRGVKRQGRAHYRQSGRIVKRHLSAALAGETRPRTAAAHAGYAPCGLIDVQAGDALRVRCCGRTCDVHIWAGPLRSAQRTSAPARVAEGHPAFRYAD